MLILILGLNHLQVNYPYLKTPYVNTLLSVVIVILLEIFYLKSNYVNKTISELIRTLIEFKNNSC